jgi:hypothetical protein
MRVPEKRVFKFSILSDVCLELRICIESYRNNSNMNIGMLACDFGTKLFTVLIAQEPTWPGDTPQPFLCIVVLSLSSAFEK